MTKILWHYECRSALDRPPLSPRFPVECASPRQIAPRLMLPLVLPLFRGLP